MLDHVSITVADLDRAATFYDAVMAALDVPRIGADADWLGYGARADAARPARTYLSIRRGARPAPAHGRHWCFKAESRAQVDRFFAEGLRCGGTDDGPPGPRPRYHPDYYAAFLIDPDGNRVEAVCHRAPCPPRRSEALTCGGPAPRTAASRHRGNRRRAVAQAGSALTNRPTALPAVRGRARPASLRPLGLLLLTGP